MLIFVFIMMHVLGYQFPCSFAHYPPWLTSIVPFFPFQVLATNRVEESQSHVHRMYFMGRNTFSEPWLLPHTPPEEIKEIV